MAWVPQPTLDPHFGDPRDPQSGHDELVSSGEDMSLTSTAIHMALVSQSSDLVSEVSSSEEEKDSLLPLQQQLAATSLETFDPVQSRELTDSSEKVSEASLSKEKDSSQDKEKDLSHSRETEHSQNLEKDLIKSENQKNLHSLEREISHSQEINPKSSDEIGISNSPERSSTSSRQAALSQSKRPIGSTIQEIDTSSSEKVRLPDSQEITSSSSQDKDVSHTKDSPKDENNVSSQSQESFSQEEDLLFGQVTGLTLSPHVTTNLLLISKTQAPSSPPSSDNLRGFFLPVR